jgi:hypothetical protein
MSGNLRQELDLDQQHLSSPPGTTVQRVLDILALAAMALYGMECSVGSSGRWLQIGPISIRMILFALAFVLSLPRLWQMRREVFRGKYLALLVVYALWLGICFFLGVRGGNRVSFAVADLTSLMGLALLPGFVATIATPKRAAWLSSGIFYACAALSLAAVVIHLTIPLRLYSVTELNTWINAHSLGGLAQLTLGVQRVYFRSQIFCQVAILIGLWRMIAKRGNFFLNWAATALIVCSLVLSYTRGFWLGLAIGFVALFVLTFDYWKQYLKCIGCLALSFAVFLGVSWLVYQSPVASVAILDRFDSRLVVLAPKYESGQVLQPGDTANEDLDEASIEAVNLRAKTMGEQLSLCKQKPIQGWGLGKNLDGIRTDGKTEYTYYDMWMKTGLIGLALFLLVFFTHAGAYGLHWIGRLRRGAPKGAHRVLLDQPVGLAAVWVAAYISVAATSYVNPFLTSPLGIAVLLMTAASVELCLKASKGRWLLLK